MSVRKVGIIMATAVALVCAGLPAHAARDARPTVAGATYLSANTLSEIAVAVPDDATISLDYFDDDPSTGPRFSRGAELAALIIVPDKVNGTAQAITAARLPRVPKQDFRHVFMAPGDCLAVMRCDIPAGDYRLIVVTDAPVRIRINFEGLGNGTTRLHADTPTPGSIEGPSETYHYETPSIGTGLAAYGTGFRPTTTGDTNILFSAFWFHGPTDPAGPSPADKPLTQLGTSGSCIYFEDPPQQIAFMPGCPTGQMGGTHSTQRVLDDFSILQWTQVAGIPAGTYGMGNYAIHTGIFDPGFVGFWVGIN